MPTSEARTLANRANAARSTGPRTEEGKARSRANSYKHGMTGGGVVLPEEDAAEVARRSAAFRSELRAEGEVGRALALRMATLSVRLERAFVAETAALDERVDAAMDGCEVPEGLDDEEAATLRGRAGRLALFDPSKEAALARKYEAAAERGFFRCLKEIRGLRRHEAGASASTPAGLAAERRASLARLGSFLQADKPALPATPPAPPKPLSLPTKATLTAPDPFVTAFTDIPITIGRRR